MLQTPNNDPAPGDVIGHLTVIGFVETSEQHKRIYEFQCRCGKRLKRDIKAVLRFKSPHCESCLTSEKNPKNKSRDRYRSMLGRCHNPQHPSYDSYGAVGIRVCNRWLGDDGFDNYYEDVGPRPAGCTLDRIDNSRGYSPDNVRWVTYAEQALNKRCTYWIELEGAWKVLRAVVDDISRNPLQLGYKLIKERLQARWTLEEACAIIPGGERIATGKEPERLFMGAKPPQP